MDEKAKLRAALQDWLWYAEGALGEFDIEAETCDGESLCPRCREVGCIQLKIRNTRATLAEIS